jgi:hypothetical protein
MRPGLGARKVTETMLPAASLREIAQDRAGDYWQSIDDRSHRSSWNGRETIQARAGVTLMQRSYAFRYGISLRQAARDWQALQEEMVGLRIADRFCTFLGVHPMSLWPEDYAWFPLKFWREP